VSISPAVLDALLAAGVTAEQIVAAVKADIAAEAERASRQIPWVQLRALAFERDGECCGYCGTVAGPFEVDHVIPRAKGGENILENVRISCRSCNRAKKDRDEGEWSALAIRREKDRIRKRAERAEKRGQSTNVHGQGGRSQDTPLDKETPHTPKKLNPRESILLPARDLDLPEGVTPELWDQYRAMRSRIRKPLNAHAEQLALKKLRKFAENGHPPGQAVEDAIVGSYQGLFEPKADRNGRRHDHLPDHDWGRTVEAAESVIAELQAKRDRPSAGAASAGH
jgi:hypothetical protein